MLGQFKEWLIIQSSHRIEEIGKDGNMGYQDVLGQCSSLGMVYIVGVLELPKSPECN